MLKNYVRNFETQQTVTIELFNSLTGKKTLEAEIENVINLVLANLY